MSARRLLRSANGSDGWLSTGASTASSTIIPSANPPVKHMPTTPTPGPPQRSCSCRASARSHDGDRRGPSAAPTSRTRATRSPPTSDCSDVAGADRLARARRTATAAPRCSRCRRPGERTSATSGVMPGISRDHDDRGPRPGPEDRLRLPVGRERVGLEPHARQELGDPPGLLARPSAIRLSPPCCSVWRLRSVNGPGS